jgi:hypothetical protein
MCRTFQSKRFNWNLFFQSSYTELRSPKTLSPSNYNPWLPSNFLSQTILRTLIHFLSQTILRTLILLAHSSHAKISNIQKRVSLFIFFHCNVPTIHVKINASVYYFCHRIHWTSTKFISICSNESCDRNNIQNRINMLPHILLLQVGCVAEEHEYFITGLDVMKIHPGVPNNDCHSIYSGI